MPQNQKTIGKLVKRLREERGLSRKQLATKAGVTYGSVYGLENGLNPSFVVGTAYKLARAMRLPVFRLLMTEPEWAKFNTNGTPTAVESGSA